MQPFLNEDFLLTTTCAQELYHRYAAHMPIVDYHCHVSAKEIYENRRFENITEVWLSGDHYKWRLMRANGVEERFITGDAPAREKFQKFAETLPRAIGNPVYHWCHLELKNYFGYEGALNGETAEEVWQLTRRKLAEDGMRVRGLIEQSNVIFIGTTDDPVDDLCWHRLIAEDRTMQTIVAPSFRPDKALNIEKSGWREYIAQLSVVSGTPITGFEDIKTALQQRIDYFNACGCCASDHGLDHMVYAEADAEELDAIVKKALAGESVNAHEAEKVKTALLIFCAGEYVRLDWAMQIHYNCLRNPNSAMFARLGPDSGYDCVGPQNGSEKLAKLLDTLYGSNKLPRTILYSLDAADNLFLDTLIGSFQGGGCGRMQHGSAWWFNDNKTGMREQLTSLANQSLLGNFVGMLTDSRSFLSYARHEYFRRVLCDLIGGWVEAGEYPADLSAVGAIVQDICTNNSKKFFKLK